MRPLADRVSRTSASGIRRIFDLAANLKDPIDLSIGQPDFDAPANVRAALAHATENRRNAYTPTQGAADLRAALLERFPGYGEEGLLVTSAVSGGLVLAYLALLDPGDEILVPDPYFVMYKQLAVMFGATPVYYDTYPDWKLRPERVAALVTPRTKAVIVGSPSNPTGAVYDRAELAALAEVLRPAGLVAVADEIYEGFCYDGPFTPMREVYPEGTLTLGGLSKSHALTGWRVGWAAGPAALVQAMAKFQQFTFVCAPAPAQAAAVEALRTDVSALAAPYRARRDRLVEGLQRAGYDVGKPAGAFYLFPRAPWGTGTEFVTACVAHNLLAIPGGVFSERDTHFRLAYPVSEATVERALEVFARLVEKP